VAAQREPELLLRYKTTHWSGGRESAAMVAKVGGVFGTLRHHHLIQPYLAYYDHLASHYGGPLCSPICTGGAIKSTYKYLSRLSMQKCEVYRFLECSL
jgi:hypothetical protein